MYCIWLRTLRFISVVFLEKWSFVLPIRGTLDDPWTQTNVNLALLGLAVSRSWVFLNLHILLVLSLDVHIKH